MAKATTSSATINLSDSTGGLGLARVPYVNLELATSIPGLSELYADISTRRGAVLNLYQAIANQPSALRSFMGMSRHVREESSLDPALRELAILATGFALKVPYEAHHHRPHARKAGISETKLGAFPAWGASAEFSPIERAVLSYADEVARTRTVLDTTFQTLCQHFNDAEIVELAMTVAWYHFVAAILGPLEIEIEDE
jgi:4-carboxymuconolactone decarboxylase